MKNRFKNKTLVSLVGTSILLTGATGPIVFAEGSDTTRVSGSTEKVVETPVTVSIPKTVETSQTSETVENTELVSTTNIPQTIVVSEESTTTTTSSSVKDDLVRNTEVAPPIEEVTTAPSAVSVPVEISSAKIGQNWNNEDQVHLAVDTLKFDIAAAEKEVKEYYFNGIKLEKYTDVNIAYWDGIFRVENKDAVASWKEAGGNEFKLVFNDGTEYVYKQPETTAPAPQSETTTTTQSETTTTVVTTPQTTVAVENTSKTEVPIEISSAQIGQNWKKEDQVEFSIDIEKFDIIAINNAVKEYYFNGIKLEKFMDISVDKWDGLFRIENKDLIDKWKEAGENELKLIFNDGSEYVYKQPSPNSQPSPQTETTTATPTTQTETTTTTVAPTTQTTTTSTTVTEARVYPDFSIKNTELYTSYGEKLELNLTVIGYQAHTRILKDVDYYEIDGVRRESSELGRDSEQGKFGIMNQDGVQAWKEAKDKVITLVMKDGQKITFSPSAQVSDAPKVETTTSAPAQTVAPIGPVKRDEYVNPRESLEKLDKTLADDLEDGEYTIGFSALRADGKIQSSMLEGFFDENVKLVVKEGKKYVEMLNTMFADGLLDLKLQNKDGSWSDSTKENYGEADINNKYKNALFTIPVENVEEDKVGAVLVSYMGGKESDKGDLSKYARLLINFKTPIYKGFNGYDVPSKAEYTRINSDRVLNRRLRKNLGLDADNDGTVTPEELKNYKGDITIVNDLSDINDSYEDVVYEYSILKHMGPDVNSINIATNKITVLPSDAFANASGLKEVNLASNGIESLPADLFANNTLLEKVQISSNRLGKLPVGLFKNNPNIKELDLSQSWLAELDKDIFASLPNLEKLYLNGNNIEVLPEEIFANNPKLTHLYLDENEITKLPVSIGKLSSLEVLSVNNTELESLPAEMKDLRNLKVLRLKQNKISEISDDLWKILADNKATVDVSNNNLSKVPVELLAGKLERLNLAYNNLPVEIKDFTLSPEKLGLDPTRVGDYFPQKPAASIEVSADNKEIKVNNDDLTLLDLVYWYWGDNAVFGGKGVLQTKRDYLDYRNAEMKEHTTDLAGVIKQNKSAFKWIIDTVVERDRNGVKSIISQTSLSDKDDQNISIRDEDMQNGDVYTVSKVLSLSIGASHQIAPLLSVSDTVVAKVEEKKEISEEKSYKLPIKLLNLSTRDLSMGNVSLDGEADIIEKEDGSRDIVVHFKSIQMGRMKGNVLKIATAKSLDDAKNSVGLVDGLVVTYRTVDGQEFPKSIRISNVGKDIKEIPARVWVDAMERIAQMSGKKDGSQPVIIVLGDDTVIVENAKGKGLIQEAQPEAGVPNITAKLVAPLVREELPEVNLPITRKVEALVQEELPELQISDVQTRVENLGVEKLPVNIVENKKEKKEEYTSKVANKKESSANKGKVDNKTGILPKTNSVGGENSALPAALASILVAAGLMTRRKEK